MSEEREGEQAGAPVEQPEATDTQVFEAVERATESTEGAVASEAVAASDQAEATQTPESSRPLILPASEPPSASDVESATEIFEAHAPQSIAKDQAQPAAVALPPERDGEIRISADHPMAALYMQTPMAPEIKGNRGAGVLIALLATVAFAAVYVGVLALWQAPNFGPSRFLNEGLLPWVLNWGFAAAVSGFFVALTLLVLIVGRAGWWAYAIGGLLVAVAVWAGALLGYALDTRLSGGSIVLHPYMLAVDFGLLFPVIAAGVVAREVSVWFGAWIGARGRRVKRENAEAVIAYEQALAEVQAK